MLILGKGNLWKLHRPILFTSNSKLHRLHLYNILQILMKFSFQYFHWPRLNHYRLKLTIYLAIMSNGNAKGYLIHVIHCVHVHFRLVANDNKK